MHEIALAYLRDAWTQESVQVTSGEAWITKILDSVDEARQRVAEAAAKRDALAAAIVELEKHAI